MQQRLTEEELIQTIACQVAEAGGRAYYVGGRVRDYLLGQDNKDVDIEVHGITPEVLESILDGLGKRITIGESFGVYNLKGYGVDIAMPRKETATGRGHRDFQIDVDPYIGTRGAALRRDFTFNAMMQDILSGEIIDHFGGQEDLKNGVLRHVSDDSFPEDPLRVLRGAQFAARFHCRIAPETLALCGGMDLSQLPPERVMGELQKAMLKSDQPSVFFDVLREMGQLDDWFPEIRDLIDVEQDPRYHQEGDVWTHSMMVLDQAVNYREQVADPLGFMLAALTHDLGKVVCMQRVGDRIHAIGHEKEGLPLVAKFMKRLTREKEKTRYVLNLVEYHMKPNSMAHDHSSIKSTNKLFDRSVDPEGLIAIAVADSKGMIPPADGSAEEFLRERLTVFREYMDRPYVSGKDLLAAGLTPGEDFRDLLAYAHKLRLAGIPKESALKQTLAQARSSK